VKLQSSRCLASLVVVALAFGACGGGATQSPAGTTSGATPTPAAEKLSIGQVTISATDDAMNQVSNGSKARATELGWDYTFIDPNGKVDQANAAIENLVAKKVDAIIVNVWTAAELGAGLAAARDAGIPVISIGSPLAPGLAATYDIGLGQPVWDRMFQDLGPNGIVLNLTYHPGGPCHSRADTVDAMAAKNPGMEVTNHEFPIPGFAEDSLAATNAWLASNPKSDRPMGIFNCFDGNALGAISALKENNRLDVFTYAFNGTGPALQAIQEGTMTASEWFDWVGTGRDAVDLIAEVRAAGSSWQPKTLESVHTVVDKSTIEQFLKDHPDALK